MLLNTICVCSASILLKPGPSLQVERSQHSSSKINRKIYLVVVGGKDRNERSLNSVELLDTTSPHQGWISGN